jgi:signal transduction histidine kinase
LKVTISDSGEGIKKEDLPRITDPYYTSKPSGTGLGLAIVQKILDAHGGSVHIESQEGVGTKVTLQFPVSAYERMKNEESI